MTAPDPPSLPCPACGAPLAPAEGRGRTDRDGNEVEHRISCRCHWCDWRWYDDGTVAWRLTGARVAACLPLPGAVPSLCAEWRSAVGGRVWRPCDPRPGCEGCATLAEHRCEP